MRRCAVWLEECEVATATAYSKAVPRPTNRHRRSRATAVAATDNTDAGSWCVQLLHVPLDFLHRCDRAGRDDECSGGGTQSLKLAHFVMGRWTSLIGLPKAAGLILVMGAGTCARLNSVAQLGLLGTAGSFVAVQSQARKFCDRSHRHLPNKIVFTSLACATGRFAAVTFVHADASKRKRTRARELGSERMRSKQTEQMVRA